MMIRQASVSAWFAVLLIMAPGAYGDPAACHRLATDPRLNDPNFPGVPFEKIDAIGAIVACEKAVDAAPDDGRLRFQLARAYSKAERDAVALPHLKRGAELGDALAQIGLYTWSERKNPIVTLTNEQKFAYVENAADKGLPEAKHQLAVFYFRGLYTARDIPKAVALVKQQAEAGRVLAMRQYAQLIQGGHVAGKTPQDAAPWFEKAANEGDVESMAAYGFRLLRQRNKVSDGVQWLEKAANKGHAQAKHTLVRHYGRGRGRSPSKEVYWLKSLATDGDVSAQISLGNRYYQRDLKTALGYYRQAEAAGSMAARWKLADHYADKGDMTAAKPWLDKFFETGDNSGRTKVARVYFDKKLYRDGMRTLEAMTKGNKPDSLRATFRFTANKYDDLKWLEMQKYARRYLRHGGNKAAEHVARIYMDHMDYFVGLTKKPKNWRRYGPRVKAQYDLLVDVFLSSSSIPDDRRKKFLAAKPGYDAAVTVATRLHEKRKSEMAAARSLGKYIKKSIQKHCGRTPRVPSENASSNAVEKSNRYLKDWYACMSKTFTKAQSDSKAIDQMIEFEASPVGHQSKDRRFNYRIRVKEFLDSLNKARADVNKAIDARNKRINAQG